MKLEAIDVKHLRSLLSVELHNCGGFNVLIGKNNAGKSNLLASIDFFFQCVRSRSVSTLNPPVGSTIDFCNQATENPIEISTILALSPHEEETLLDNIINEAPRMKNAVENLRGPLKLRVCVRIVASPIRFAYVSEMSLVDTKANEMESEHVILRIGNSAAGELCNNLSQAAIKRTEGAILTDLVRRIDGEDWERIRQGKDGVGYLSYYVERAVASATETIGDNPPSRMPVPRQTRELVSSLVRKSQSQEEFRTTALSLVDERRAEASGLEAAALANSIQTFSGEETTVPAYVLSLISEISQIKVLHLKESRKAIGREEATRLLTLKVKRGGEQDLGNIKQTVQELLGVQIDAFQSDGPAHGDESAAELDVDSFLVQANGSGIREALRVIFDNEFSHPNILLVEEPETHLHPALETNMMRYLKRISSTCQVFITTHSTNFLDTSDMNNVYLVSKAGFTTIQRLDIDDAESQLPRELGLRLSSVFMFDRLVFVEGPSDEAVLREWALTLNVNLSQPNVGFVHMGGVRNFAHYATDATLSFLSKRQVKMIFLMDRDEKDEPDILKIRDRLGGKAEVRILQKRELENYLLCPRSIAELIRLKLIAAGNGGNGVSPTEKDITASISDAAERLKQATIEKRVVKALCQPVVPDRVAILGCTAATDIGDRLETDLNRMTAELEGTKSRIAEVCEQQAEFVEREWASNRLSIVQGDVLLDEVCKSYGVRFIKVRDSPTLARLMLLNEIDLEIQGHIRDIGR